jgi:hypothetical protein
MPQHRSILYLFIWRLFCTLFDKSFSSSWLSVAVEWSLLQLYIQEVSGLDLGLEVSCPDWGTSNYAMTASNSLFSNDRIVQHYIYPELLTVSLNVWKEVVIASQIRGSYSNEITVSWNLMPSSLVDLYWHFRGMYSFHLHCRGDEGGGSMFLQNISNVLPDCTVSQVGQQ